MGDAFTGLERRLDSPNCCTYNSIMETTSRSVEDVIANECLAGRVRVLNRVVTGIYDDVLRPHNLRVSQLSVLVAIAFLGPVTATSVCRRLRLDKSTLSRDLERLLARKLVRASAGTGRTKDLEATAAGRALLRKVMPAWEEAQAQVREMLGAALTKNVCEAVQRLRATDEDEG